MKCNNVNMTVPTWSPGRPYNDLPPLPPAIDLEPKPVLKRCVTARAALAELKQAAELIPNQAMLINTLPLLEARAHQCRAWSFQVVDMKLGNSKPGTYGWVG